MSSNAQLSYVMGADARWYIEDLAPIDRAQKVTDVVSYLYRELEPTRAQMVTAARMYGNLPLLGLSPRLYRQHQGITGSRSRRICYNVVKSVVDTYTALICKDQPKVSFVTSGGDWSLQRKAKLLEKFVDGTFYEADLHLTAQACARDSALFGMGLVKVYCDESRKNKPRVAIERVLPWELIVDDQDAVYGSPQCLYHVKFVDKRYLISKYPEFEEQILMASDQAFDEDGTTQTAQQQTGMIDLAAVIEAWHLPENDHTPGRHSVVVGAALLEDEPYEDNFYPFEILYRQRPIQGVWGYSIAEELCPIQVEMARLLNTIQMSQMKCVPHWLVENNADINTNAINNVVASMIRYTGTPPQYIAPQTVASDLYSHLQDLYSKAYELIGVSQMAAQSQKPAGLNSGKAMLVYADVQSQRFQPAYREYQHWYLGLAHQCIHLARKISEKYPDFAVKSTGKSMQKTIVWADANLDEEEYSLELFPTNALADDPAARMQVVQDMINSGMISPDDGKRLLNMPDLETQASYDNSIYDNVMRAAEMMIEDGKYFPPEPLMGPQKLADAVQRMTNVYFKARLDQVDEEKLQLIRRWIDQAQDMATPPPPPPAPPPPAGMAPAGPPAGPPAAGPMTVPQRTQELQNRNIASTTAQNLR